MSDDPNAPEGPEIPDALEASLATDAAGWQRDQEFSTSPGALLPAASRIAPSSTMPGRWSRRAPMLAAAAVGALAAAIAIPLWPTGPSRRRHRVRRITRPRTVPVPATTVR